MYIEVEIKKPLYGTKVFIRDKYIKQAQKEGKKLRIISGDMTGIYEPSEWLEKAEKMEKVFNFPDRPMILWGNYLKEKDDDITMEQYKKNIGKLVNIARSKGL